MHRFLEKTDNGKQIKLFCLPYAGGSSAMIYSRWKKYLHSSIELIPLELKGRGTRLDEPFYKNFSEAAEDVYRQVESSLAKEAGDIMYAVFGHSMGSTLGYECSRRMSSRLKRPPIHLFCSARCAPHVTLKTKQIHRLPDEDFQREILKLGATSNELFQDKALMEMYMPILRADFKIIENYEFSSDQKLLNCDFTVLHGLEDSITDEELIGWKQYTQGRYTQTCFPGDHFFIFNSMFQVVELVNHTLISHMQLSDHIFDI